MVVESNLVGDGSGDLRRAGLVMLMETKLVSVVEIVWGLYGAVGVSC